jgi:hypothetical protein
VTLRELIKRGPKVHCWIGLGLMTVISVQEETAWPILTFVLLQIGLGIFGIVIDRQRSITHAEDSP